MPRQKALEPSSPYLPCKSGRRTEAVEFCVDILDTDMRSNGNTIFNASGFSALTPIENVLASGLPLKPICLISF